MDYELKQNRGEKATERDLRGFRTLAGEMIWIGCGTLPQAMAIASYVKQNAPWITVADLVYENTSLKEMKDLQVELVFISAAIGVTEARMTTLSDAYLTFHTVNSMDRRVSSLEFE